MSIVSISRSVVRRDGRRRKEPELFGIRNPLKRHFTDDAITEMTALIAFQNLSARFNAALDIPAQGLCATFNEAPHA